MFTFLIISAAGRDLAIGITAYAVSAEYWALVHG
jgi:hypothetical protein